MAHRSTPAGLIIGNSRPELGLNPANATLQRQVGGHVYNLGMPGASVSVQYGYAVDVMRANAPKLVLVGLDFMDYLTRVDADASWPPPQFAPAGRMRFKWDGDINTSHFMNYMIDVWIPLITLDGLIDSFYTVLNQSASAPNLLPDGFNPPGHFSYITNLERPQTLFKQKNEEMVARFATPGLSTGGGMNTTRPWKALRYLLDEARSANARLVLFINPYHGHYLQAIDGAGLLDDFHNWKRQLVAFSQSYPEVTIWDFSNLTEYHTERVYDAGPEDLLWFWEPAHYKAELGDIVLDSILSGRSDLGVKLRPEMIEMHIDSGRGALRNYQKNHRSEFLVMGLE